MTNDDLLGMGGVFGKNKKTDKVTVFGTALGASAGVGKKWTMEDSLKLSATVARMENNKER